MLAPYICSDFNSPRSLVVIIWITNVYKLTMFCYMLWFSLRFRSVPLVCVLLLYYMYLCRYFIINIVFRFFVQAWWYPWRFPRENVALSSHARWEPCLEKVVLTPLKQLFTITFFVRVCAVQSFKSLLFFLVINLKEHAMVLAS
jgi:hypothetical protein